MSVHADYWRVKAAYLLHQLTVKEAQSAVAASQTALHAVLREASLDPAINYQLTDADQSIVPVPA